MVQRLKERHSDAFDRFLEGVVDNRQVAFDDDGWRLKTDPAEPPDPAQSDRLAELHRWLDARSRTIRLADLLIEVENDLGFSVHFQQPGETRVDPGEVCALLAAILAHGCNLGLYTMEKVAPDIAYRRLKYVSDWRLKAACNGGSGFPQDHDSASSPLDNRGVATYVGHHPRTDSISRRPTVSICFGARLTYSSAWSRSGPWSPAR